MRKTIKSHLLKELEDTVKFSHQLTEGRQFSASVIDFMKVVQSINLSGLQTFGDLVGRLESAVFTASKESRIVAVVPDRYDVVLSIKTDERKRRQKVADTQEIAILNDNQSLPMNH